ncbi:MAG: hypothetical protein AB8B55_23840 [Mariniblastus sp.]
MRSLLIATAMCAAALTFSGCSFTVSGPCTTLSHQSRIQGCGCQGDDSCGTCNMQPECAGANFGDGAPAGMANIGSRLRSMMPAPSMGAASCDGDCGGGCDGDCGGGMLGGNGMGGNGMGMRMFDSGSECETVSTDGGAGLLSRGIRVPSGRLKGAIAGHLGSHARGCGRFGCGREGKLCLSCRARGGLFNRQPSEIPHTAQPPGMMGPGGQAPQYVYPYYTTRGPRDFLQDNPPTIGY